MFSHPTRPQMEIESPVILERAMGIFGLRLTPYGAAFRHYLVICSAYVHPPDDCGPNPLFVCSSPTHTFKNGSRHFLGAGDGNRTHVFSLEGCCTTIVLRPHFTFPNRESSWIIHQFFFFVKGDIYHLDINLLIV